MNKLHFPFGTPPAGMKTAWRITERVYSVIIDAEREEYGSRVDIEAVYYEILKETPCGIWIQCPVTDEFGLTGSGKKFINLKLRKKYACLTIPDALDSFLARKRRQRSIYQARVNTAHDLIKRAKELKGKYDAKLPEHA
mgnify:CR=1 FL=1